MSLEPDVDDRFDERDEDEVELVRWLDTMDGLVTGSHYELAGFDQEDEFLEFLGAECGDTDDLDLLTYCVTARKNLDLARRFANALAGNARLEDHLPLVAEFLKTFATQPTTTGEPT